MLAIVSPWGSAGQGVQGIRRGNTAIDGPAHASAGSFAYPRQAGSPTGVTAYPPAARTRPRTARTTSGWRRLLLCLDPRHRVGRVVPAGREPRTTVLDQRGVPPAGPVLAGQGVHQTGPVRAAPVVMRPVPVFVDFPAGAPPQQRAEIFGVTSGHFVIIGRDEPIMRPSSRSSPDRRVQPTQGPDSV